MDSVQELQKDVNSMEAEKEQLSQKLSNIKRKTDTTLNNELFNLAEIFRDEKDKSDKMSRQVELLEKELKELQQKTSSLKQKYKEVQNTYQQGATPEDLIEKMEDEVQAKQHMVKEVLPRELEELRRYVLDLEEIDSQPGMSGEYLERIKERILSVNRQINDALEKRMLNNDPMDDKLALFRQNVCSKLFKLKY